MNNLYAATCNALVDSRDPGLSSNPYGLLGRSAALPLAKGRHAAAKRHLGSKRLIEGIQRIRSLEPVDLDSCVREFGPVSPRE